MEQIILVKHKQAYDTEENWKANNPILLEGQLAYSSDKYGKYKIGDGITHWCDLEYCNEKIFTGTRAEYEEANINGAIKPGTIVNIIDDNDYQDINIDTELSEESENLVTNQAITKGLKYNDSKDNTVSFTSEDNEEPEGYSDVELLKNGEKHSSILNKLSIMFKNVRYLYRMLGTTDISSIGGGTVTGAISGINADLLHRIPKTILLACKGRYLCTPGAMDSFNYYQCIFDPREINGMHCFTIWKSHSINYTPAGNYDSGIIVSKNVEDFTGYRAIVIKGHISSDYHINSNLPLTVRAYCLIGEATGMDNGVPYDYTSWNLLAETDTEKTFEAHIAISDKGKEKISFGLYHGDETINSSVFLAISEITLIPVR